ncbi:hypothetical protein Q7P37_005372 [Cladosporium fusiforme]
MPVVTRRQARAIQAQAPNNAETSDEQNIAYIPRPPNRIRENHLRNVRYPPPRQGTDRWNREMQETIDREHQAQRQRAVQAAVMAEMERAARRAEADPEIEALLKTICAVAGKALRVAQLTCRARVFNRRLTLTLKESFSTKYIGIARNMWSGIFLFVLFVAALHLADVLLVRRILSRQQSLMARERASEAFFLGVGRFMQEILPWVLMLPIW